MKAGDLITYYFSSRYPFTGVVLKKWKINTIRTFTDTYGYTIEILECTGVISTFDIHHGDRWEVHA